MSVFERTLKWHLYHFVSHRSTRRLLLGYGWNRRLAFKGRFGLGSGTDNICRRYIISTAVFGSGGQVSGEQCSTFSTGPSDTDVAALITSLRPSLSCHRVALGICSFFVTSPCVLES